jgi:hypothetical protein
VLNEVNEQIDDLRLDVNNRTGMSQLVPSDIDVEIGERNPKAPPLSRRPLRRRRTELWCAPTAQQFTDT